MMHLLKTLIFLTILSPMAFAQEVEWNEPEVVPEKLVRRNRRVLRFSGVTKPGNQLRVRDNKVKMYLDNGKTRSASLPQKNKIQFPVVADGNGEFTFDIYLPTVAVEIPIEIYANGKWVPYKLNFRVPDEGSANDFQAVEESFQDQYHEDEDVLNLESEYNRKRDKGQYVRNRGADIPKSPVEVYLGAGFSYFNTSVSTPNLINIDESDLIIPTWRLGVTWDYNTNWDFLADLRSSSGSIDQSGGAVTGADFNWLEFRIGGQYFLSGTKIAGAKMGIDFGFAMEYLPLYRINNAQVINTSFFDNPVYNLYLGLALKKMEEGMNWPWEVYARYYFPISSGDDFDIESSFPLMFELGGGARKQITPGLALGVYGQFEYFDMDVSYLNTGTTAFSLMLFTADVRLIANF